MESSVTSLTVPAARAMLRAAALRSTSCRVAVLQFVSASERPLSHAEVSEQLVPQGFDKSTIYRCLVEMADAHLVSRLDLGDHVWRFELHRKEEGEGDHPHFVCIDCGKVSCLPEVQVKIGPSKRVPPVALGNVTQVLLKGHCEECTE